MKTIPLTILLCLSAHFAPGQTATEIYLFDLSVKKDKIAISNPVNITNHKGYDNQPYFHPELPIIYFASFNDDGRSDIRSYNYKTKATVVITETAEREYSPTVTLDQQSISCIIQRDNGAQDLGKYPIAGGDPFVIVDNMTIGYHVWADNSHLGLFVLGTPNTLHYLLLPVKRDTVIAENIGRSLHRVPGESAISFVHKVSDSEWLIKKMNTQTLRVTTVVPVVDKHEDLCWLADGKILMSDGVKLYFYTPGKGDWKQVTISSGSEILKDATRLAVSSDGKKLAIVVAE